MAGSRRNFQYTADNGNIYLFGADESNTEAVNGSAAEITLPANINEGVPRNIKMRRVYYSDLEETRIISAVAATPTVYNAPPASIADPLDGSVTLGFSRKAPEQVRVFKRSDTGLTDGDSPS